MHRNSTPLPADSFLIQTPTGKHFEAQRHENCYERTPIRQAMSIFAFAPRSRGAVSCEENPCFANRASATTKLPKLHCVCNVAMKLSFVEISRQTLKPGRRCALERLLSSTMRTKRIRNALVCILKIWAPCSSPKRARCLKLLLQIHCGII